MEQIIKKFDDVKEITGQVVSLSGSRDQILRLQAKKYCQDFARLFKKQNREKNEKKQAKILKKCGDIKDEIKKIVAEELQDSNQEHELSFVKRFIKILSENFRAVNKDMNNRFLDYFGYLLESTNEEEMYKLRDEYSIVIKEIKELEIQFVNSTDIDQIKTLRDKELVLSQRINTESFGREHFFREIGLIYHFEDEEKRDSDGLIQYYLDTVADLMLKGYAIELMDGDNSFIWNDWIMKILEKLGTAIKHFIHPLDEGNHNPEPKGIAISIMGL